MSGKKMDQFNRRNSLPAITHQSSRFLLPFDGDRPKLSSTNIGITNRRHTLMPIRSILKASTKENQLPDLAVVGFDKEKRRVSFAPEVTLHKIDYSRNDERKSKRRSSLLGFSNKTVHSPKMSTSEHVGKKHRPNISTGFVLEDTVSEIDKIHQSPATEPFLIDEDCTTQTMEMSVELTQQILKQQEQMKEQNQYESKEINDTNTNSLHDIFEDIENDSYDDNIKPHDENEQEKEQENAVDTKIEDGNESEMEFTEVIHKASNNSPTTSTENVKGYMPTIDRDDSHIQEKPQKLVLTISTNDEDIETMELTQPISHFANNDEQSMELTEFNVGESLHEQQHNSSLERGAPIIAETKGLLPEFEDPVGDSVSKDNIFDSTTEFDQPMELTGVISKDVAEKETRTFDTSDMLEDDRLSTVMEMTEPITSDNQLSTEKENLEVAYQKEGSPVDEQAKDNNRLLVETNDEHFDSGINEPVDNFHSTPKEAGEADISQISSDIETSLIGTEMVPLAEITADLTENGGIESESDNSFADENYVNVSLDTFLQDVNVQFFDNIGPSETEINNGLVIKNNFKSLLPSSSSSSSPLSSVSLSSTPSTSNLSTNRHNIMDYVNACANIPYYHYLVHLISQYQSSVNSISTMVNTFSNDVLESNPTAIREFYQQSEQIKSDLCTNYQAIASFTRKQTKSQNMKFIAGLLDQLILSYEHANQQLESDLSKALEWRKNVLIERQKMIGKKVELDKYIQKLNSLKENWGSVNIQQIIKANETLKNHKKERTHKSELISEISDAVDAHAKRLDTREAKKKKIIAEINELREKVKQQKVPSEKDLLELKKRFEKLEEKKSVQVCQTNPIVLKLNKLLSVRFEKESNTENVYKTFLYVEDMNKFTPFQQLVTQFISKHQAGFEQLDPILYLKKLKKEWSAFMNIWKDFMIIYYSFKASIIETHFIFVFKQKGTSITIEGDLSDLIDMDKEIKITLFSDMPGLIDNNSMLNRIVALFDHRNCIVNRFAVK